MKKAMNQTACRVFAGVLTAGMLAGSVFTGSAVPAAAASAAAVAGASGEQADLYKKSGNNTDASAAQFVVSTSKPESGYDAVTGTITVSGVESEATVKAYQIVDGYYTSDGKLVKYVQMDPTNALIAAIGNEERGQSGDKNDIITAAELTTIANKIQDGTFTADNGTELKENTTTTAESTTTTYTGDFEPGMYIILVTPPAGSNYIYNPAVGAVNISDVNNSTVANGNVDMASFFTTNDGTKSTNVYVKSSTPGFEKKITGSKKYADIAAEDISNSRASSTSDLPAKGKEADTGTDKSGYGDTVAIGDTVKFVIDDVKIPSFSDDYTKPFFYITDTLDSSAFSNIKNLKVYIKTATDTEFTLVDPADDQTTTGETTTTTPGTYKITDNYTDSTQAKNLNNNVVKTTTTSGTDVDLGSKNFRIEFTEGYLKAHKGDTSRPELKIEYEAALTEDAGVNFAENVNHAEIHYSNNPGGPNGAKVISKNTYHYTFAIGGDIDAQDTANTHNQQTTELIKVDQATGATESYTKSTISSDKTVIKAPHALKNATFGLYSDAACNTPVKKRTINSTTGIISAGTENYTAVSDDNGRFSFTGLDEGTYYIRETNAPSDYTLSDRIYKVVIAAELDSTTGILKKYTVTISSKAASASDFDSNTVKTTTYTGKQADTNAIGADGHVTYSTISGLPTVDTEGKVSVPNVTEIVDTKLQTLPSTGGEGTVRFIIIAAVFAGAFVVFTIATSRKHRGG